MVVLPSGFDAGAVRSINMCEGIPDRRPVLPSIPPFAAAPVVATMALPAAYTISSVLGAQMSACMFLPA